MPDTADKSDDLIAELAKLMASGSQGRDAAVNPIPRPAPLSATPFPAAPISATPSPAPVIRIPGMDAPPAPPMPAPVEPRAPATGTFRIPGMDQPAPVTTSAPVSKFDFGKPSTAPEIKQEPLSSIADRIASQASATMPMAPVAAPVAPPISFAPIATPSAPPASERPAGDAGSGFNFDFGFNGNPPQPQKPANDPIADLIAAELEADPTPTPPGLPPREARPVDAVVTPIIRVSQPTQGVAVPAKPTLSPMAAAVAARPTNAAPVPLKPLTAPLRAPESDRFAISPGIGLNGRPSASQPLNPRVTRQPEPQFSDDESDPMTEIENLIGEAVRVELSAPGPVKVQAAPMQSFGDDDFQPIAPPVVPPLTTGFAPRRSDLKDADHSDAAEEAILAAAATSGAELGRLEGPPEADSPYRRLKVKPAQSGFMSGGMRQYVGMAVAGTLLLVAGLGLYWVLNMGRGDADAPTLVSDTTAVKAEPPSTEPATAETASPVLAEMEGTPTQPSAEVLVSTDETAAQDVARVVGDTTTAAEDPEGGLANRKVRTVTVRPDGTIVSSDDAVAGATVLPVDRPTDLPTLPMDNSIDILNPPATSVAATTAAESDPIAAAIASDALGTAEVSPLTSTASATLVASIDPSKVAPIPAAAPDRSALAFAPAQQQSGPVTAIIEEAPADSGLDLLANNDTPEPVVAAPASANSAVAYVQLASSLTEAEANNAIAQANARYGNLFGGNQLLVQRADLGEKGIRYRVRLPTASLTDATRICAEIKATGGDCFATAS